MAKGQCVRTEASGPLRRGHSRAARRRNHGAYEDLLDALAPFTSKAIRVTQSQDLLLPDVVEDNLPMVHRILRDQGWDALGFESGIDVTSCPGTDTCNLAISNSTHLSTVLEHMLEEEFPHLMYDRAFSVKISGCMNACGQHSLASFGLHGSSMRRNGVTMPAMQVLIEAVDELLVHGRLGRRP